MVYLMGNYRIKWIIQRVSATILIPLTFWFVYNCVAFSSMSYNDLVIFFKSNLNSFLFLFMSIVMLFHAKLGCETIFEDYIKSIKLKKMNNFMLNLIIFSSMFVVIFSILRINFLNV